MLAEKKGHGDEFRLVELVERLTPEVFAKVKGSDKPMCANVDMYSGFVYKTLDIPVELYTPLFAAARIAGWIAHRIEEICGNSALSVPRTVWCTIRAVMSRCLSADTRRPRCALCIPGRLIGSP